MDEQQAGLHAAYHHLATLAARGGPDEQAELEAFMAEHTAWDCGFEPPQQVVASVPTTTG